jgi:hypothetical protein
MVVLGVIVLIVVAVVAVTVVYQGGDEVILELPGFTVDTTGAGVFVGGVVCTCSASSASCSSWAGPSRSAPTQGGQAAAQGG